MNWAKIAPYLGWPLAAIMFSLWLGLREDLAEQAAVCNQQKLTAVAEAERLTREMIQDANSRRLLELENIVKREQDARALAEMAGNDAKTAAAAAQETIRRLMQEVNNSETATIEQVCLLTTVPADALDGLR